MLLLRRSVSVFTLSNASIQTQYHITSRHFTQHYQIQAYSTALFSNTNRHHFSKVMASDAITTLQTHMGPMSFPTFASPPNAAFPQSSFPGIRSAAAEALKAHSSYALFDIDDAHLSFQKKRDFWTTRTSPVTGASPTDMEPIINFAKLPEFAWFTYEGYKEYCWDLLSGRQQNLRLRRAAAAPIATSPGHIQLCECGQSFFCDTLDEVRCETCWKFFVVQTKRELYLEEVNSRWASPLSSRKQSAATSGRKKVTPTLARSLRTISSAMATAGVVSKGTKRRVGAEEDDSDAPPAKRKRTSAK